LPEMLFICSIPLPKSTYITFFISLCFQWFQHSGSYT
jgi:hypothetical protein